MGNFLDLDVCLFVKYSRLMTEAIKDTVGKGDPEVSFSEQALAGLALAGLGLGGLIFGVAGLGYEGSVALWKTGKDIISSATRPLSSAISRNMLHR